MTKITDLFLQAAFAHEYAVQRNQGYEPATASRRALRSIRDVAPALLDEAERAEHPPTQFVSGT